MFHFDDNCFKLIFVRARRVARAAFLRAARAVHARCIIARLLEPALAAALNQPKRARQTGFLRAALSAAIGDALSWPIGVGIVLAVGNGDVLAMVVAIMLSYLVYCIFFPLCFAFIPFVM